MSTNVVEMDNTKLVSNIISKESLRRVQVQVLKELRNAISQTFGPAGSNTLILHGTNKQTLVAEYSKDGHKVLKNITYQNPIELSIQSECENITHYVEKKVGDGTSSAVILSSFIFEELCAMERNNENPYEIIRGFKKAVSEIKEEILINKRDITLDDIYDIALISTNGNEEIAGYLMDIYREHGFDVFIDVSISNDANSYSKSYDGVTFEQGYSDEAYINVIGDAVSRLNHPRVYAFQDPIDTPEMVSFLETIINNNILLPYYDFNAGKTDQPKYIPTLIMTPKISSDVSGLITKLVSFLYQFKGDLVNKKPPICIITNFMHLEEPYHDIVKLCGAPFIRKYIDPKIQEKDVESGMAPTIQTVCDKFYGTAEQIDIENDKAKFINPDQMYEKDNDGNIKLVDNTPIPTSTYDSLLNFLESELYAATKSAADANVTGKLKRRINALKANMVEYFVGGVTISDRDSLRDLVEDAVLNCRSAALNGVGFAANFEGFNAVTNLSNQLKDAHLVNKYYEVIKKAYRETIHLLYSTIYDESDVDRIINECLQHGCPLNINTGEYDGNVITSIDTDIIILDCIARIITIMFTANQVLVQVPALNTYEV